MIKRANIPVRARSYSENDLLQRKKDDCHDHVMDFTPGQVKVIIMIERIVNYLANSLQEKKGLYNLTQLFKRLREYVAGERKVKPDPAYANQDSKKRIDKRLKQILCTLDSFKCELHSFPPKGLGYDHNNRYYYSRSEYNRSAADAQKYRVHHQR